MKDLRFEGLKLRVAAASAEQILELEDVIQSAIARQSTEMALARRTRETLRSRICPHCHSSNVVLHGKDLNRRQRFKCRSCHRTFNIMTGTPMARARKPEKWGEYLGCMTEHMSVRKIAASGIGIHQVTAWRWRHRFLKGAANDNAPVLSGVIEADTTFFARSFKGSRGWTQGKPPANRAVRPRGRGAVKRGSSHGQVPVLTALDTGGGVFEAILTLPVNIEMALEGRIAAGSVLCSDGSPAYVTAAGRANAEHYIVSVPVTTPPAIERHPVSEAARRPGRLGLGRVSNHRQRLMQLVNERCRGVATKYLGNYLGWHRAMTRSGFDGKALLPRALCGDIRIRCAEADTAEVVIGGFR